MKQNLEHKLAITRHQWTNSLALFSYLINFVSYDLYNWVSSSYIYHKFSYEIIVFPYRIQLNKWIKHILLPFDIVLVTVRYYMYLCIVILSDSIKFKSARLLHPDAMPFTAKRKKATSGMWDVLPHSSVSSFTI